MLHVEAIFNLLLNVLEKSDCRNIKDVRLPFTQFVKLALPV